jgi:plasmid stabilization system protein ParE
MEQAHRVILTNAALGELEAIASFIYQHSPQNAALAADRILNAINSLVLMPDRFKKVGASRIQGSPIHAMVVRPFIIY